MAYTLVADASEQEADGPQAVSAIRLGARVNNQGNAINYPKTFDIQVTAAKDKDWITVLHVENCDWSTESSKLFTFSPTSAYKLRLLVTDMGGYENDTGAVTDGIYFQLSEMAIYKPANLAKGAAVTATNSWEYEEAGLSKDNLTDGVIGSFYTSMSASEATALDAPITIDLGSVQSVGGVRLYPRSGNLHYVKNMTIQASADGVDYATVLQLQDIIAPEGESQFFVFPEAVEVQYIRIVPDEIQNGEDGYYRFQLVEIEIAPAAQTAEENTNPIPPNLSTQSGATMLGTHYDANGIAAKNDNPDVTYNVRKAIDGITYKSQDGLGFSVPESYNLEEIKNIEDVEIHIRKWWYHNIYKVGGVSEDGTEIYYDTPKSSVRPIWIENAYEFIDQAGEWYIDKTTNTLYYKAAEGITADALNAKTTVLPVAEKLLVFDGCDNVTFDGVCFEYTTWTFPTTNGYQDAQSGTFVNGVTNGEVPGGIEIGAAENITITNCEIRNMGAGGIRIWNDSQNNEISNCAIHDISSGGIWVGSMHGHIGSYCDGVVKDNVIYNNYITRVGVDIYDASGITVLYTEGTVVDHNEICNTPYTGISLGWGWASNVADCTKDNVVSNNYIHDTGLTVHDGASIYTLGNQPGTKIYGNYVHTHGDVNSTKDAGLYLDEGSTGIEVYNNVVGKDVYWWSTMWTSTIKNNHWHDNYHQVENERNNGTDNIVENNTYVPDGNFEDYPEAKAIIDNAGLKDENVKAGVAEGMCHQHNRSISLYSDEACYYFTKENGLITLTIPEQIGNTQYDWVKRTVEILMPEGTDITALAPVLELESGYTSDKASGAAQDFTNPVTYTLTGTDSTEIAWTVKVNVDVTATGTPEGTEVTLDTAILNTDKWTVAPVTNEDGSITFRSMSGYLGERFGSDTILQFDMSSALNMESKDWMGYALRSQDPYNMLGTMYHVCFNNGSIEVQKWVNGNRSMLFGTIEGYTPVYGDLTNDYYTPNERHSIVTGAIDVPTGVRLFLYVDGNKIFDIIDTENPISGGGYFVVYPMTQSITLMNFSDIQNVPVDFSELESTIESAEAVEEDKYTAETYKAVKEALKKANEVLEHEESTQDEVDAAVKALKAAIAALEEKNEDGGSGNTDKDDNAGNSGNTGNGNNTGGNGDTGSTGNGDDAENNGNAGNNGNANNNGNAGNNGNNSGSNTNNTSEGSTNVTGSVSNTSESASPQTGDNFNVIGVTALSILAIAMIVWAVVHKRHENVG